MRVRRILKGINGFGDRMQSIYTAKILEYSLAVFFLLLFIPFWKYVQVLAPA